MALIQCTRPAGSRSHGRQFFERSERRRFSAPARFEADVFDCEVKGQIPRDLDGAFYRAVTDWFYPPRQLLFLEVPGALPRIDERYGSLPYRYGYVGYGDPARPCARNTAVPPRTAGAWLVGGCGSAAAAPDFDQ